MGLARRRIGCKEEQGIDPIEAFDRIVAAGIKPDVWPKPGGVSEPRVTWWRDPPELRPLQMLVWERSAEVLPARAHVIEALNPGAMGPGWPGRATRTRTAVVVVAARGDGILDAEVRFTPPID
jgi:hypothetical protein